jgi:hypothetical protein
MLSPVTVSGGFLVRAAPHPATILARLSRTASEPAVLTVRNRDTAATLFFRWIALGETGATFPSDNAGIVLGPNEAYTWDKPPRNAMLACISSVDQTLCAVDGNWTDC